MIASLKRAIVHILAANSGVSVYSEEELDVPDASINSFITKHIEKKFLRTQVCEMPNFRKTAVLNIIWQSI